LDTSHTLITKHDVEVMRLLTNAFNEAIKSSPNFEEAIEKMVFSQRESIPELKHEDFHTLLKSFNSIFLSKAASRERVIDLIHHILSVDVHPGWGG
jgi:CRP-like cAMP-binding protein